MVRSTEMHTGLGCLNIISFRCQPIPKEKVPERCQAVQVEPPYAELEPYRKDHTSLNEGQFGPQVWSKLYALYENRLCPLGLSTLRGGTETKAEAAVETCRDEKDM